jgi:hypothetical protein
MINKKKKCWVYSAYQTNKLIFFHFFLNEIALKVPSTEKERENRVAVSYLGFEF